MKWSIFGVSLVGAILATAEAQAINFGSFGPRGEGGAKHGQEFRIGTGGLVHELDAFVHVGGLDLNGPEPGTSASLSRHSLPAGLVYQFSAELSTDRTDVTLTYLFSNRTASVYSDLRFFVLLDAEIDQTANTFFDEYGIMSGSVGAGAWDSSADMWQIDEPGFLGGTLIRNCLSSSLSNSNAVTQTAPDDVALGLGFLLGDLGPGESLAVRVMISEDGDSRGSLALTQRDAAPNSLTVITLSGEADRNPFLDATALLQLNFRWGLDPATGHLLGTLLLANPQTNSAAFGAPFRLGLRASPNFALVQPAGVLPNGLPYVDLTAAVISQAGAGGSLDPGELVVVDGIEIDSRDRSPPPNSIFELWASRVR